MADRANPLNINHHSKTSLRLVDDNPQPSLRPGASANKTTSSKNGDVSSSIQSQQCTVSNGAHISPSDLTDEKEKRIALRNYQVYLICLEQEFRRRKTPTTQPRLSKKQKRNRPSSAQRHALDSESGRCKQARSQPKSPSHERLLDNVPMWLGKKE